MRGDFEAMIFRTHHAYEDPLVGSVLTRTAETSRRRAGLTGGDP